ncbi:hypothetical protein AR687_13145 [Flavobacteriaceae bacterium CRH]|nr:hypothetical protein AR687_13145 [Flavobacteriaceae bacterium CRH]
MEKSLAEKLTDSALGYDIDNVPVDVTKEAEKEDHLMKPYDPKSHSEYIELKRFEIEQANESSERKLRQENAKKAFVFSSRWAIFIAIVILLHGFGASYKFYILSQTEFLFVIGTLTASIFAFYTLVLKYLFYRKPTVSKTPVENKNT